MNDGYEEILVKRQSSAKDTILKALVIAVAVAPVVYGVVFAFLPAILIGIVLGFVGYYFLLPMLDIEYEYLYVAGDIDIDKIMSKRKRKKVASYSKDNLEIMAPEGSDHVGSFMKGGKVLDYTSGNPDVKAWIVVYSLEKGSDVVRLELTPEIAQDMRRYAPRKVFFD